MFQNCSDAHAEVTNSGSRILSPESWIPDSKLTGSVEMDPHDAIKILDSGFHTMVIPDSKASRVLDY